jgi:hypothetical protein
VKKGLLAVLTACLLLTAVVAAQADMRFNPRTGQFEEQETNPSSTFGGQFRFKSKTRSWDDQAVEPDWNEERPMQPEEDSDSGEDQN